MGGAPYLIKENGAPRVKKNRGADQEGAAWISMISGHRSRKSKLNMRQSGLRTDRERRRTRTAAALINSQCAHPVPTERTRSNLRAVSRCRRRVSYPLK